MPALCACVCSFSPISPQSWLPLNILFPLRDSPLLLKASHVLFLCQMLLPPGARGFVVPPQLFHAMVPAMVLSGLQPHIQIMPFPPVLWIREDRKQSPGCLQRDQNNTNSFCSFPSITWEEPGIGQLLLTCFAREREGHRQVPKIYSILNVIYFILLYFIIFS